MFDRNKPMDLGDIFSNTFSLLRETFSRNILVVAIFLIPAGILLAFGVKSFFSGIADMVRLSPSENRDINPADMALLLANAGIYIISIFVFLLAYIASAIGVTKVACSSMEGERISLAKTFGTVFSITFIRYIGIIILFILAAAGLILASALIIAVTGLGDNAAVKFIGGILVFAAVLYMIFLFIRWYFASVYLIDKNTEVIESLGKSYRLVKGYWWRTLGIILLTSIAVNFAVSIITTPISFLFMWDFISQYYVMLASGSINEDPEALIKLMKSMGLGFGLSIILSTLLQMVITPLFQVVMYFDLRVRKNEFEPAVITEDTLLNQAPDGE